MPYLPEDFTHPTVMPQAYGADVLHAIRVIEEKWARFYPQVNYFCLRKDVTVVPKNAQGDVDTESVSGTAGGTVFDPVLGEAVDNAALVSGWKQPHLSGDTRAVSPERFMDPVRVHAQVRREAKEKELKKLGFDEVRDLLLTIPTSMLDKLGIVVTQGDRFVWDNDLFEVLQFETTGYWKNTNLRLYMILNCRHYHPGS
jgi:hypothetical protein